MSEAQIGVEKKIDDLGLLKVPNTALISIKRKKIYFFGNSRTVVRLYDETVQCNGKKSNVQV